SRMRSLYALHLSLSVAISTIQPRLRLSGTNRLRSVFHGGQRWKEYFFCFYSPTIALNPPADIEKHEATPAAQLICTMLHLRRNSHHTNPLHNDLAMIVVVLPHPAWDKAR
ncbi:MAG: hypothetical protein KZQ61_09950, partial [Candidatus Thiodiazotropha sp. (ex Lucinoma aequizonata)]|nr:hypothetical protein [Candidatus Thiodiazotropha sp. (ex Lucinoma aequizonata)]